MKKLLGVLVVVFIFMQSCDKEELVIKEEPASKTSFVENEGAKSLSEVLLDDLKNFECDRKHKMVFSSDQVVTSNNTYYRFKWLNCDTEGPFEVKLFLEGEEGFVCGNNTSQVGSVSFSTYFDFTVLNSNGEFLLSHMDIGKKAFLWKAILYSNSTYVAETPWTCFGFADPASWVPVYGY